MYKGIEASRGIGIGSICLIVEHDLSFESKHIDDTEAEKARFNSAIDTFKSETAAMAENIRKNIGPKEAEIMEGHLAMIADPTMAGEMTKMIEAGQCAEAAVTAVCDMFIGMFSKMEDDMMRQRASDISDIKISLLKLLLGIEDVDISKVAPGTVIVAHDLTPSMTSQIVKDNVVGIITEVGGKTSHSAILARALEIPAVLSVPNITELVHDKDTAIVDGTEGDVHINPDGEVISQYIIKREEFIKAQAELKNFLGKKTVTADGTEVELFCNIGTPKDARKAVECDGEGIGLFRSEFLFMDRPHLPTEDEQFEAYKEAVETMKGKTVIIRTLDIGGDKDIPYLGLEKEENPFLGYRAVRYCLSNSDTYKMQLRGILRASAFGKVKIMIPLVTCVEEVRAVKALVEECKNELKAEGVAFDENIEVGCMVETAAASLIADMLAKEADFFSIGTNDLTQYTMSVDRGNANVAYLYSAFQPAVLRSIKNIIEAGNKAGITVGMCGEAAADPLMIPLLISFGLNEYSVNPVLVLTARSIISKWSKEEADALAAKVLSLTTEKEIVELLKAEAK
ncbi:MAG: phosphoenolpyruvate--protein phosphotransferase [Pseudobutyrivibrio sp.]|uniref:phosphoenolpyruvate--protein phosphotransferase n=1 Tax=Pseudobutyrivibrio sp. TaxID=2014367 RepID=UPI001B160EA1|nr:phosphoenolpyruvate--protein phosphotransferase [Pseudobutyrivibrio sp.]MBO5618172.1 phosphoenolpyruvate--protein phosphotransferase [Pseudobutyrivibrio sp.]MBO6283508.1 phosphoenolpyruvate--protein phosphotransferase [Pseudobutyrivibrio sp.]MBP3261844.1 phosphoenolpyruvate--protein phosphotransferase [Pseudobutyrivibrio sp.]